jgi:N-acetylneuraminic acid mutarotase
LTGRPSDFKKALAVLAIVLLLPPLGAGGSEGSSTISESCSGFSRGTFNSTMIDGGTLALDYEYGTSDSWPDNWTLMNAGRPGNLTLPMAYDSANDVLVMEQGTPYSPQNYTWIYHFDTAKWERRTPPNAPAGGGAIAYDSSSGVVIMHYSNPPYLIFGETWAYNFSRDVWYNMSPAGGPVNLTNMAMVFDSVAGVMVIFGGGWASPENETWTYNYSTNTWTNMCPERSPPASFMNAVAFDESAGETILFGGQAIGTCNDTWSYNYSKNTWTQRFPAASPPPLARAGAVYDSSCGEIVLFGGASERGYSQATWAYSFGANNWTLRHPPKAPSNRSIPGMAFNSREKEVVLYGGYEYYGTLGDLWTYNSSLDDWTEITDHSTPSPRIQAAMAYHGKLGKSVVFGGFVGYRDYRCETYILDLGSNTWTRAEPATRPPGRCAASLAYDPVSEEVVLFGGHAPGADTELGDTWTYDAAASTWTDRGPPTHPGGRELAAMVTDSTRGKIMLFGGMSSNAYEADTWSYDVAANTWTELFPPYMPNGRAGHAMAYDARNDVLVMFGGGDGYCTYSDTWIYNISRNTWTNRTPGKSPPPGREYPTMAYDEEKGLIFMFGGLSAEGNDTWCYNTTANRWTKIDTRRAPGSRYGHAMAYDEASHVLVLFGGCARYDTICSDVWAYDLKHFTDSGDFTSAQLAPGGDAFFGTLAWEADIPAGTAIRLQLRSAEYPNDLLGKAFVGPDGTPSTYYERSGQRIASIQNGSRWVQYRAYFTSADPSITPRLRSVTFEFNLPPAVSFSCPQGGENWTSEQTIRWTARDPDGDELSFDLFLENETGGVRLAMGLPNGTDHWRWNTTAAANGSYRLRLVAGTVGAQVPVSIETVSANFTIFHPPPPNNAPHVELLAPPDGSVLDSGAVRLGWRGSDPDGDLLTYTVSYSVRPLLSGQVRYIVTTNEYADLTGLDDNTTYYWTVNANDTVTNRTDVKTPVWRFTVKLPPPNHPPRITSVPRPSIRVGEKYAYNVTAFDVDNDPLVFSMVTGHPNMTFYGPEGILRWWPCEADVGNTTVTLEVSDGRGGTDRQTFVINVLPAPIQPLPEKPRCSFTHPTNNSSVHGLIVVKGSALAGLLPLIIVRLRIDGGEWTTAIGLENWSLVIDTSGLSNGRHRLEAWSFDGSAYSDCASIDIVVENGGGGSSRSDKLSLAVPGIVIAVAVIVAAVWFRRRR